MADVLQRPGTRWSPAPAPSRPSRSSKRIRFDVIITDLQMPGMNGLEFIRTLAERRVEAPDRDGHGLRLGQLGGRSDAARRVRLHRKAVRRGAARTACRPRLAAWRESGPAVERPAAAGGLARDDDRQSAAMKLLRERIAQAAPTDETVLISGESGTGKELVARCLHAASRRSERALVGLNCPALSPQLMESELFGHERGAFTSADAPRVGPLRAGRRGHDPARRNHRDRSRRCKPSCCGCCKSGRYERVGSSQSRQVDVRVIATTNRDLRAEVAAGRFRQDLYYRLAVVAVAGAAAAAAAEDVPQLVEHFLAAAAARLRAGTCELVSRRAGSAGQLSLAGQCPRAGKPRHAGQRPRPGTNASPPTTCGPG